MTHRQVAAALLVVAAVTGPAAAQAPTTWETRAEVDLGTALPLAPGVPSFMQWTLAGHVEIHAASARDTFTLTLDPGLLYDGGTQSVFTLTETFLQTTRDRSVVSLGVERIPLEVARLTIPYSIEPVDILLTRAGVAGARLQWFPDDGTRVRVAVLADGVRVSPLLSFRREFTDLELEGHVLLHGGRTALGLGGSGLLGTLVVYGELWSLTDPQEWRYAAGVSGSVPDGLWTVEYGYASAVTGALPRHQIAAQLVQQYGPEVALTVTGRLFADPDAYRSQVSLELSRAVGNLEYTVNLLTLLGPEPAQAVLGAGLRLFF